MDDLFSDIWVHWGSIGGPLGVLLGSLFFLGFAGVLKSRPLEGSV